MADSLSNDQKVPENIPENVVQKSDEQDANPVRSVSPIKLPPMPTHLTAGFTSKDNETDGDVQNVEDGIVK